MDRKTLESVRDTVLAQHRMRLEQPSPPDWLVRIAEALLEQLLDTAMAELFDPDRLRAGVAEALDEAQVRGAGCPAARFALREAAARMQGRETSLAEVVGPQALAALDALLARPDVVDEALLAELAGDEALEQVMQDVLFDALEEFSKRVNPFVAEWGLPALLDQLPLFGKGTLRKAFESMRGDFDRRLEPEIRKFLKTFAKKSVARMVELTVRNRAEPAHVAMRQQLARRILDRPLGELCWAADDPRLAHAEEGMQEAMVAAARHAFVRALIDEAVDELWERWKARTAREVLDELAIDPPPVAPLVEAAWPLIRATLRSDALVEALAALLDEAHTAWLDQRP